MYRTIGLFLVLCLWLVGCASPRQEVAPALDSPLPYRVSVEMTSAIPDPYYVLSGPSDSYRRFPFNNMVRSALVEGLEDRSGSAGAPMVRVLVHLLTLETSYWEMGSGPGLGAPLYSGIAGRPLLLGGDLDDGDSIHIPTEMRKGAQLTAELQLQQDGRPLLRKNLAAEASVTVYWENFNAWSYDYGDVLDLVIARLVKDVEGALRNLPAPQ